MIMQAKSEKDPQTNLKESIGTLVSTNKRVADKLDGSYPKYLDSKIKDIDLIKEFLKKES